jgi:arylsulfatase A-like enzyme
VLLLALSAGCSQQSDTAPVERPNVIVMLSDDQATFTLGCEGHPWSQTPALDQLAQRGIRFSNSFVTTSLCSPSRASLLTGQYSRRHGVRDNRTPLPPATRTFASLMTDAGYDSAYLGKWHMGDEGGARPGFSWTATIAGQGSYYQNLWEFSDGVEHTERHIGGWVDDVSTTFAIDFVRRKRERPFLMFIGLKGPHRPYRPAKRNEGVYADVDIEPPQGPFAFPPFPLRHEVQAMVQAAGGDAGAVRIDEGWAADIGARRPEDWMGTRIDSLERARDYFRVIYGIDENVARLVKTLQELGELDRTLIVYTSDNGLSMGRHGVGGKHTSYEEATRVPLIISYPRALRAGVVLDELVLNIDVAPTLLDYAGISIDESIQGRSLRPVLEGRVPDPPWRVDAVIENFTDDVFSVSSSIALRGQDWKLIRYPGRDSWTELFDLASDPEERLNLAQDSAYAQELAGMLARLHEVEEALGPRQLPVR